MALTLTQTEAYFASQELRTAARALCGRTSPDNRMAEILNDMAKALLEHRSIDVISANGPRVARMVGQRASA